MSITAFLLYLLTVGQAWFVFAFFLLLFGYLIWKTVTLMRGEKARAKKLILASGKLLIILIGAALLLAALIGAAHQQASVEQIAFNNEALLQADVAIFNVPGPYWFQLSDNPLKPLIDTLTPTLLFFYLNLSAAVFFCFLLVMAKNRLTLARMTVAFFLCPLLSLPFWFAFPATSPVIAFDRSQDVLEVGSLDLAMGEYEPNEALEGFFAYRVEENGAGPITTIPSMHIAWASVIMYYVVRSWGRLRWVAPVYLAFVYVGSVLTLQHYLVDVLAGVAVAVACVLLARRVPVQRSQIVQTIEQSIRGDVAHVRAFVQTVFN